MSINAKSSNLSQDKVGVLVASDTHLEKEEKNI
jgi:hypothetical protein